MQFHLVSRRLQNCLLLSVFCLLASLTSTATVLASQASVLNVQVAEAREALRPQYLRASGLIKPWDEIKIDSQIGDVPVVSAPLRVGTVVHRGELLARFASSGADAQLTLARAILAQAKAVYADALMKQRRAFKLHQAGMLSAQDILDVDTRTAVAQAQMSAAAARLEVARINLSHTRVLAPVSGIISSRSIKLGEVLRPGAELYRVIRRGELQWQAALTAEQLSRIKAGMLASVRAAAGTSVAGKVTSLSPALDSATQTGLAYVALKKSPALRADMYVTGKILLAARRVLLVPSESIIIKDGRSYAVTYKSGHALFIPVIVGSRGRHTTEVLKGLSTNAELIVQGAGLLDNGAPVTVVK